MAFAAVLQPGKTFITANLGYLLDLGAGTNFNTRNT